jgi:hypothetical protein
MNALTSIGQPLRIDATDVTLVGDRCDDLPPADRQGGLP